MRRIGTLALVSIVALAAAPGAVADGAVERALLRQAIMDDPALLKRVEAAIHPLVAEDRRGELARAEAEGQAIAVLDIPLIFETGAEDAFDYIVVASAPPDLQRARVLERPGMSEAAFEAILAKQVPDAVKRARADLVIDTGAGMDAARAQVEDFMAKLGEAGDA